jgi:hypothetical protein
MVSDCSCLDSTLKSSFIDSTHGLLIGSHADEARSQTGNQSVAESAMTKAPLASSSSKLDQKSAAVPEDLGLSSNWEPDASFNDSSKSTYKLQLASFSSTSIADRSHHITSRHTFQRSCSFSYARALLLHLRLRITAGLLSSSEEITEQYLVFDQQYNHTSHNYTAIADGDTVLSSDAKTTSTERRNLLRRVSKRTKVKRVVNKAKKATLEEFNQVP